MCENPGLIPEPEVPDIRNPKLDTADKLVMKTSLAGSPVRAILQSDFGKDAPITVIQEILSFFEFG